MDFYRPFLEKTYTWDNCFLCGLRLGEKNTEEHIFPKWLQHKFELWDQKLILTNKSKIPYRNLTVPCCPQCNNNHLSKMETRFQKLISSSFKNLSFDDELTIFQWTGKIIYAIRFKELSLLFDRKNPELGKILTPEEIESYSTLQLFLQSIRFKTIFDQVKPWSIFIFQSKDESFFYQNNLTSLSLMMKFGEITICIVFEDNNCVEQFMQPLKELRNLKLNSPQLMEVTSYIFYSALLKEKIPSYFSTFNEKEKILRVNPANRIHGRQWNDKEFGVFFDHMLDKIGMQRTEDTYQENGLLSTYLIDENGKPYLGKYLKK
jgi:hypothetical protein